MANRAYLYSVDAKPEPGKVPKPVRSLSEHNWDIPLAHKILASVDPQRCQSVIWTEHRIAIVADYAGGVSRLTKFLDRLGEQIRDAAFVEAVAETREVLSDDAFRGELILLEAGEVFDMMGGDLGAHCDRLVAECADVGRKVDAAIAGGEQAWLTDAAVDWQAKLGLYWADVLYFDFAKWNAT
jgi:hypothetical protein